jgi:phage nucleotide-binding protein
MALTETQRERLRSRITDPAQGRHFKAVFYGVPSTGKTVTAASLSDSNLLIMTETGDSVLTKPEHLHLKERTKRTPFTNINSVRGYAEMLASDDLPYSHLIIDNMSGVQDKKISENLEDPRTKDIKRAHPDLTVLQDYQIIAHQMRPMVVDLMSLEKDVTIICHFRAADPEHNEYQARPDLTKAIYNLVNEKADVVAYFYKNRKGERFVQTLGNDQFVAKARIIPEAIMSLDNFIEQMNKWRSNTI